MKKALSSALTNTHLTNQIDTYTHALHSMNNNRKEKKSKIIRTKTNERTNERKKKKYMLKRSKYNMANSCCI